MNLHKAAWVLMVIGAINWGLVGIGGFIDSNLNVVNMILGSAPQLEWIVYVLVGVAGVYSLMHKRS